MMSVTVCGFASGLSSVACFDFGCGPIWESADASCRTAATLVRGVRTGSAGLLSADLAGAAVAVTPAETGFASTVGAVAASSSSSVAFSSVALPLNRAANRLNLPPLAASSPLPRFSTSARASSYPFSGTPSEGTWTVRPSGNTLAS